MTGHSADFWTTYQPGFRFSAAEPGTSEFFTEVERHRYELEPHIPEIVDFPRWASSRVLEVGCGPGHLSILLARRSGLDVTGVDLDPAMIERARANASGSVKDHGGDPSFLVGDVASLAFPDGTFDVVVSTLSMHHWADPTAGLSEIARVLRPDGRALVWDFRAGAVPLHGNMPDPAERAHGSPLRLVGATRWRWPWRFRLTNRIELARADGVPERSRM